MADYVNRIALQPNRDSAHRIRFRRGGRLESMTLAEVDRRAASIATRLRARGIGRGDRVGVMARNRIEWVLLDLAILKLGGVTTGFDAARFDAAAALQRYGLHHIFVEGAVPDHDGRIVSMDEIHEWLDGPELELPAHDGYGPETICAIKFTSGSTGLPKGLETTAGSINDSLTDVQEMFEHGPGDNILIFLRLALLQQRYWIYSALVNGHDATIANLDDMLVAAQEAHPTIIMGVPWFFEDVKRRLESAADLSDLAQRRSAIQSIFGGGVRYLWTGSAPAGRAVLDFYNDCGVPLYQGYGLNETCIVAKNHPRAHRIGSVGKVLPNVRVRFDSDGVLIVGRRHPVNTHFTWCAPGDNEKMFLPSGEVRTHDLAYLDGEGFLYVLGRVDDIVVLSSGRNVLVPPLEERIRAHPAVEQCVLYGTGKPFLTALISPAGDPVDAASIQEFIEEMNATLLAEQRIHGIVIAGEKFSIENGLLTSQFKPVRKEIARRFAAELADVYAPSADVRPRRNFVIEA